MTPRISFKAEFVANKEKYRANYIIKEAKILNPGNSITNEINTFVAAKEVAVIDGYAEQLGIEKFDLAIDWGWFYFFTKPLFFIIDYFFKLTGKSSCVLDENLTVACKSNSIQILELQRQGKNKQTAKEFLLGKKISAGSILN